MKETMIVNISHTNIPIEQANRCGPLPRLQELRSKPMVPVIMLRSSPPVESKRSSLPCPMIIGERSSKRTDLRDAGAASIRARQPFSTNPKPPSEDDRREGVGRGTVPRGGTKVR